MGLKPFLVVRVGATPAPWPALCTGANAQQKQREMPLAIAAPSFRRAPWRPCNADCNPPGRAERDFSQNCQL